MSRSIKSGCLKSVNDSDILPRSEEQEDVFLVLENIFYPAKISPTFLSKKSL